MNTSNIALGCVGEVMLELVPTDGSQANLGVAGDTYNTAVYLRHSAPEVRVDYITGLGRDGMSQRILREMAGHGVNTERVFLHPDRLPGLYAIETDSAGERSFTYWRSASAARTLGDPDMPSISSMLSGLSHVFLSGISLAILSQPNRDRLFDALEAFQANGGKVAFDSNYRPKLWDDPELAKKETEKAWTLCDIAMPSVDDEMALFGETDEDQTRARFQKYGIKQGVLKRGAKGPIDFEGASPTNLASPARVIDTTAAGDSFNAAYLAAVLTGRSNKEAMEAGHALACRVIAHRGAIIFSQEESQ